MKNKILSILFISFLTIFFILNIVISEKEVSKSERRKLKDSPKITLSNILNGKVMEDFDEYTTDQFILRDTFRNIKANVSYKLFRKSENLN